MRTKLYWCIQMEQGTEEASAEYSFKCLLQMYLGMECEDAIATVESGSDYGDDTEKEKGIWGIDLNEEEGVYVNDDEEDDNVTIPLCWDSLQLENLGTNNEEFEWEEVNGDEIAEEEAEYDNNSVSKLLSCVKETLSLSGSLSQQLLDITFGKLLHFGRIANLDKVYCGKEERSLNVAKSRGLLWEGRLVNSLVSKFHFL